MENQLRNIVEAALLAAGRPLSLDALQTLFDELECPDKKTLREVLKGLSEDYQDRGIEVAEVSSGWRIQVSQETSSWVARLWDERPPRYSRALMETLALIAYRQPITRGEIEEIRGVSVSTNIVKSLLEREWIRVIGQRDVPGRPSLYGTTREFLDYFGLKTLDELPTLAELRDLDEINRELDLGDPGAQQGGADVESANTESETPEDEGALPAAVNDDDSGAAGEEAPTGGNPVDGEAADPELTAGCDEDAPTTEAELSGAGTPGDESASSAAFDDEASGTDREETAGNAASTEDVTTEDGGAVESEGPAGDDGQVRP